MVSRCQGVNERNWPSNSIATTCASVIPTGKLPVMWSGTYATPLASMVAISFVFGKTLGTGTTSENQESLGSLPKESTQLPRGLDISSDNDEFGDALNCKVQEEHLRTCEHAGGSRYSEMHTPLHDDYALDDPKHSFS